MRIAVWHNLPSGGGKRALYDHVRGLIERGHYLEAWCPPTADQSYLPLSNLITEHVLPLQHYSKIARNPVSRMRVLYRMTVGKMRALEQHCQLCAEAIGGGGFDVLLANSAMDYAVAPLARHISIPAALYLQEPHRLLYEANPILPWIAPLFWPEKWHTLRHIKDYLYDFLAVQWLRVQAREEVLSAHAFDVILVNSYFSRESVLRAYGLEAKVCYLGVDTQKFIDHSLPREDFVIGLGAIEPRKNVRLIIEALGQIAEPRPPLIWIGNVAAFRYLEDLQALAQSSGVRFEPRVKVDDHQLVDLLNRACLMVFMPRLEPFGYAPLEANACGLPVVAVAEGGVRETIIDGVNGMVAESDPREIAAAIAKLRSDKTLARRMGENGRRLVLSKWTLALATTQLEQRLTEVAHAPHRPWSPETLAQNKMEYWKTWWS